VERPEGRSVSALQCGVEERKQAITDKRLGALSLKRKHHLSIFAPLRLAALLATAAVCSSATTALSAGPSSASGRANGQSAVVVGSANFPEDEILADIYAGALEAKGVRVSTHLDIGSREIYYPLVKQGRISLFPEYNGSLLGYLDSESTARSTSAVDADLRRLLPSSLEVLAPSPAQDTDALAVTAATASRYHLTTIASLKPVARRLVIGGDPEFATRGTDLLGLARTYGLHFKRFISLDESGPLTFKALQEGTIQVAVVFTTVPFIVEDHVVVLSDPGHYYAAQNVVPLINRSVATPLVRNVLNAVSARLATTTLARLVAEVQDQHQDPDAVAEEFLRRAGISR
jgi:osmoprotectant transport system substrate-binding protein